MGWLKKHWAIILLALFVLWASQSPDPAAEVVRNVLGWVFGDFLPGLSEFASNLAIGDSPKPLTNMPYTAL